MEQELYTSCIKINGVPILPPLMTNDIREEMNYYKQLAVAVEGRLKYLEISNKYSPSLEKYKLEAEKMKGSELDTTQESSVFSKFSDDDCHCQFSKLQPNDSPSSDAVTTSTDLNHYFNESTKTTGETSPEIWKPQVPKTLNIVPITLDNSSSTKSSDETPKMVRQGSYVLDTPSPILLAHLQNEFTYVPTSSKSCSKMRSPSKCTKWEYKVSTSVTSTPKSRPRRNSASNVTQKSIKSNKKERSVKSVESIHAILKKELGSSRSNTPVNGVGQNEGISIFTLADTMGQHPPLGDNFTRDNLRREHFKKDNLRENNFKEEDNFARKDNIFRGNNNLKNTLNGSSEKVMVFFQQIQELQKRQMMELLEKQQKEQLMMQDEFKRQQSALLVQIKKVFPESVLALGQEKLDNRIECENLQRFDRDGNDNFNCRMTRSLDSEAMFHRDEFSFFNEQPLDNDSYCSDLNHDRRRVSRRLFEGRGTRAPVLSHLNEAKHHRAATVINAYAKGYLVRRLMKTEQVIAMKNVYKEALHCMLKLHVDAPLNLSELNFHRRLQLQLDAASSNIVDTFSQSAAKRMEIISHDRELKKSRTERPSSARSYSFATQRTLARKKIKEMGDYHTPFGTKSSYAIRARCQTWTSNTKEKRPAHTTNQGIKRSTSAGAVRKPWR